MKKFFIILAAVGLLAAGPMGSACYAFSVQGGVGSFTNYGPANETGTPYFNNTSNDGANANVGFFILGTGAFVGNPNSPALTSAQAFTNGGLAVDNLYFQDGSAAAMKLLALAGDAGVTSFGYYAVDASGARIGANQQVFAAGAAVPSTVSPLTLPHFFGLFFTDANSGTFYSQDSLNTTDAGFQHFALFQNSTSPGTFYLGMEDRGVGTNIGDRDYNDMVVRLAPVPLPPSALLLGSGLLGLVGFGWRRRKS